MRWVEGLTTVVDPPRVVSITTSRERPGLERLECVITRGESRYPASTRSAAVSARGCQGETHHPRAPGSVRVALALGDVRR